MVIHFKSTFLTFLIEIAQATFLVRVVSLPHWPALNKAIDFLYAAEGWLHAASQAATVTYL